MMVIENKYDLGQLVYLITDPEQSARIVLRMYISMQGLVYELGFGTVISSHYDCEISAEKSTINVI